MRSLPQHTDEEIRTVVAERYGLVATAPKRKFDFPVGRVPAESVGYDAESLKRLPVRLSAAFTGAGNPRRFVNEHGAETLPDLGCGAGRDLYLYARKIGRTGQLYGLAPAQPMLDQAAMNLASLGIENVEWHHVSADRIPLSDAEVAIVIANGILNLSPDKDLVMRKVVRVLKPGGRTVFSKIALTGESPPDVCGDIGDLFRCIGGAMVASQFLERPQAHGLNSQIPGRGRNSRTCPELAVRVVIRADKK